MVLQEEIDKKSKEIQTDSYSMSIGELMNMYKEEEIQITPDFQRYFRWSDSQKARFIESILLGIPIPPIFVAQSKGGVWDVIDGLQRLSTIFEFTGVLKDKEKKPVPPSVLQATKFLPSLGGKMWNNTEDTDNSFTDEQRIDFKRSKMDINIIKRSSDADAKYELFQRLNTGGTALTEQEIRNCLMIMLDKEFYNWINELKDIPAFEVCLPLTEKQLSEQEELEYIIRFLVYRYTDTTTIKGDEDIRDFITDGMLKIIADEEYNREKEKEIFVQTFEVLKEILGEESFKKFNSTKNKFYGALSITAFEVIITGLSENIDKISQYSAEQQEELKNIIKSIYDMEDYAEAVKSGTRPINRFKKLSKLSKEVFGDE
ncbi:DUF262 domain-containing protein [Bacillus wiedmannii]|uniref:GmrSD restriction endonucleases N-terminal domain-containing protein n=1 Tax=Bacillus wiedmannii TaxID=1890302 RepID=A0A2B5IS41_9BACI|nr:DUF262 domain-containing protein [Bacillus wiedmannii]MED2864956.1 DUF262 domain-containing protein [Bacillus thuringiensis]PFZ28023.1 hypothetical protein COL66_18500 [Bacillus wiedmannii]